MTALLVLTLGLFVYTYIGYPVALQLLAFVRRRAGKPLPRADQRDLLPTISITLPVYNEARTIAATLEQILAIDYPAERRQILVVSDGSSDATNEIVERFAPRGVELLSLTPRRGKTAVENAARSRLTGEIIINTDASVRIDVAAVRHLVAAFADPTVGVASGRDMSVSNLDDRSNPGEHAYVGYDMWVRDLETSISGIIGASGCLYAIRHALHMPAIPDGLSRDFGSALVAHEHGYRAVSVPSAVCYVPRSTSLRREYRRKVRTMARGLRTLWFKRALLDPARHGTFAWMLFSHKLCRWLAPLLFPVALVALAALAPAHWWAGAALGGAALAAFVAALGWFWPQGRRLPRLIALPAFAVSANVAVLHAWFTALAGRGTAVWEPTRRSA